MSEKIKMDINPDLKRAITSFKTAMNKKYGKDEPVFADGEIRDYPSISTGSEVLNALIGNGGLVLGRVHEIHGQSASGKSTLVTLLCANARRQYPDKFILYIDAEQAQNFKYMKALGLDCANDEGVVFVQTQKAEEVFDIVDNAVKTGGFSLVVVDSIPAMLTERELKGDFEKETMAEKARFLSKSIPKLLESLKKANTALVFVNQVRDKMDMWGGLVTPGGKSVPFYSSTRIKVNSTPSMRIRDDNDKYIGQTVEFTVVKNKVGDPFGVAESDLMFWKGFDPIKELIELGLKNKAINQSGSWFKFIPDGKEEVSCQGKNGVYDYLIQHSEDVEWLRNLIRNGVDIFDKAVISDEDITESEMEPTDE
jgi:recA bacterial DNA recombination protein